MRGVQNLEGGWPKMAISPGGHYHLGSLSVTSNRDSSLATQRSVYSASHERAVTQQGLERQNFRVRDSGGECCISECRFSASGQLAAPSAGALRSWDKEQSAHAVGRLSSSCCTFQLSDCYPPISRTKDGARPGAGTIIGANFILRSCCI